MILVKKKTNLSYINRLKKIPMKILLLVSLLIVVVIYIYFQLTLSPETLEDQMIEYSKQVTAPVLNIDIKFKNYQKLLYQRKQALKSGGEDNPFNFHVDFENVPAKLSYKGKEYKAEINLKGLRKNHFSDSTRMSFQVKLKGNQTIMGMRKFSLQDPKMRNYIYEWIFHKILKGEGFIALNYDFIEVKINGLDAGVYAIEERMDKILLERHGYTDGPIFKISDDKDSMYCHTIEPFGEKKYTSQKWKKITKKALLLAKGLSERRFEFGKTVNTDMFARYFAICDVFMFFHGSLKKSIRVYYNPVTGKFEPIGFDGHTFTEAPNFISSEVIQRLNEVHNYFISVTMFHEIIFMNDENYDEEFLKLYAQYLNKYSSIEYLDSFFGDISNELVYNLAIIYKNYPLLEDHVNLFGPEKFEFSRFHINKQAKYIRDILNFRIGSVRPRVVSRIQKAKVKLKTFELEVSNNYPLSLILKKVIINDSLVFFPSGNDFIIPYRYAHLRNFKSFRFEGDNNIPSELTSAKLGFTIAGLDSIHFVKTEFYDDQLIEVMNDKIRSKNDLNKWSNYFTLNSKDRTIKFKTGKHTIDNFIKIPKGYKVIIEAGTELNFRDSAFLLSYSPMNVKGTDDSPVKISSDKTGGIAIFDCDSTSLIRNVIFEGLSYPRSDEWKLTGAVTFYKSPVIIENTKFIDNLSEDYLNIKQAKFKISNSTFQNISSDAFDADFCDGIIEDSKFEIITNDAIDISGTNVYCKNIEVNDAGDKGFSAGEKSSMQLEQVKIYNSEIAVASKDLSTVKINNIDIKNCKLGYAAYQKKSEWGPGKITSENSIFSGSGKETLIEKKSTIILNGKTLNGSLENIDEDYLYGKKYGKKSVK
ncbi:MAG: CotH kinase family protein [Candidatus Delongbacteria bacterium]|jgi:hypothetical protein|nr:CotH kinase family protein [Candidatus Delongbacteria bacterium]